MISRNPFKMSFSTFQKFLKPPKMPLTPKKFVKFLPTNLEKIKHFLINSLKFFNTFTR